MGDNNPAEVTPVPSAICPADFTFKSNIFQLLPHTQGNVAAGLMKETIILTIISVRVRVQDLLLIPRCDELLLP